MITSYLFKTLLTLSLTVFAAEDPATKVVKAELFDINSPAKLLFTFDREPFHEGNKIKVVRNYKDPSGNIAVIEEVYYEDGKLKKMVTDHKQTNESGFVEIRDGRVYFSYTKDGK